MKTAKKSNQKLTIDLRAVVVAAEKQVELTRKRARAAKAEFKLARKAFKQAKKAAKSARKQAKAAGKEVKTKGRLPAPAEKKSPKVAKGIRIAPIVAPQTPISSSVTPAASADAGIQTLKPAGPTSPVA
jgi:colicin import membrane protein